MRGCRLPFLRNLSSSPVCAPLFWKSLSACSLRYMPSERLDTSRPPFNTTLPSYLPFSSCLSTSRRSPQYDSALTAVVRRVEPPLRRTPPRTSRTFLPIMRCYSVYLPLPFALYHRCIPFAVHMHALHWSRYACTVQRARCCTISSSLTYLVWLISRPSCCIYSSTTHRISQ